MLLVLLTIIIALVEVFVNPLMFKLDFMNVIGAFDFYCLL